MQKKKFGITFAMENRFTLVKLFEFEKVSFYTVKECYEDNERLWYDDFFKKINYEDKREIKKMLIIMGKYKGAQPSFFRHEGRADALPSRKVSFANVSGNLRLYCMRIDERNVILFSGGYKDARTAQDSQISMLFHAAVRMAGRIDEALNENRIYFDKNHRLSWDDDLIL